MEYKSANCYYHRQIYLLFWGFNLHFLKIIINTNIINTNYYYDQIIKLYQKIPSSRSRSEEVVAVGQNLRPISSQAGLQLLNVLVTLTLSHRSFNYDTDHGRV